MNHQRTTTVTVFEQLRSYLFAIAYRMLGSASEAEDVVQEAYLRVHSAAPVDIESPKAYYSAIVTRLCLDELKSARRQRERETYPGPWLAEPVPTADLEPSPEQVVERREDISLAMLSLMEQLTPEERAVYVLREAFDIDYADIAPILGKSSTATRQLGHRARQRVAAGQPRFPTSIDDQRRLTEHFLAAAERGDLAGLTEVMAADVVMWADGGPKARAARRPITGIPAVLKILTSGLRKMPAGAHTTIEQLNGRPVLVMWDGGRLVGTFEFEVDNGRVAGIRIIGSPDKLRYLQRRLGRPGSEPIGWLPIA
ncbi:MAG TPA: RNA polymerase sigma factor SigJ [Thermomicrobiales bacterium]|nr:RNA polymerase sigma factor SigJ [Thermomicrobiales bacterium]